MYAPSLDDFRFFTRENLASQGKAIPPFNLVGSKQSGRSSVQCQYKPEISHNGGSQVRSVGCVVNGAW